MLIAGPYSASTSDIEIDDNAAVGIGISTLVATTHSIAAVQDNSTSPVSYWATGSYSFAAFASGNGVAGWGLSLGAAAVAAASVSSQAVVFNYFNAGSVAENMTWIAHDNVMQLGGTEASPALSIGGSLGVSCSGTPTSSFATAGGIVTHC
jgi:hypothetical protein